EASGYPLQGPQRKHARPSVVHEAAIGDVNNPSIQVRKGRILRLLWTACVPSNVTVGRMAVQRLGSAATGADRFHSRSKTATTVVQRGDRHD
ncbi:unnamed protein product, partial [Amoebophrya sp. A25]